MLLSEKLHCVKYVKNSPAFLCVQRLFWGDKLHIYVNSLLTGVLVLYPVNKGARCSFKY